MGKINFFPFSVNICKLDTYNCNKWLKIKTKHHFLNIFLAISCFQYLILQCQLRQLYDGKEIASNDEFNDWTEYCPEEKMYNEGEIEEFENDPE